MSSVENTTCAMAMTTSATSVVTCSDTARYAGGAAAWRSQVGIFANRTRRLSGLIT